MLCYAACWFLYSDSGTTLQCPFPEIRFMSVVYGLLCFQVAKKLVKEAESNIGKKEYDANDGLVRHSDATKIQVGPHFLTFSHPPPSLAHSLTHCSLAHLLAR